MTNQATTPVTVYTKYNCVKCDQTTKALDRYGVEYITVNLDENTEALAEVKQQGFLAAPVVVTADDSWGGFRLDKIIQNFGKARTVTS